MFPENQIREGALNINYGIMLTENFALELNLPYVFINRLSTYQYTEGFHTIVPIIGIEYYW